MIKNDFETIGDNAHWRNWAPDWDVVQRIYEQFPESYSVLTPFAYTYLEELIRSTTSEYGRVAVDSKGNIIAQRKVGKELIKLAIKENNSNNDYIVLLSKTKEKYFKTSEKYDKGDNRNSTMHGYMHPRFWTKDSFEELIHDIALLSPYANF